MTIETLPAQALERKKIAGWYYFDQKQWADSPYTIIDDPEQTVATSGCHPTLQAMVASTFFGRNILPPDMAAWNIEMGFRTENEGTLGLDSWKELARQCRWKVQSIPHNAFDIARVLACQGGIVVGSAVDTKPTPRSIGRPGGHAIGIREAQDQGSMRLLDPNSIDNSGDVFRAEYVLPQMRYLLHVES